MISIEPTLRGKSLNVEGSIRATDHGQGKVCETLTKQQLLDLNTMPEKSSRSQTIYLSTYIRKPQLRGRV